MKPKDPNSKTHSTDIIINSAAMAMASMAFQFNTTPFRRFRMRTSHNRRMTIKFSKTVTMRTAILIDIEGSRSRMQRPSLSVIIIQFRLTTALPKLLCRIIIRLRLSLRRRLLRVECKDIVYAYNYLRRERQYLK